MTELPRRLEEWLRQPGCLLTPAEAAFLAAMDQAARRGVGYGFMQQAAEWAWQDACERQGLPGGAWGPESFGRRIAELEAEIERLR